MAGVTGIEVRITISVDDYIVFSYLKPCPSSDALLRNN